MNQEFRDPESVDLSSDQPLVVKIPPLRERLSRKRMGEVRREWWSIAKDEWKRGWKPVTWVTVWAFFIWGILGCITLAWGEIKQLIMPTPFNYLYYLGWTFLAALCTGICRYVHFNVESWYDRVMPAEGITSHSGYHRKRFGGASRDRIRIARMMTKVSLILAYTTILSFLGQFCFLTFAPAGRDQTLVEATPLLIHTLFCALVFFGHVLIAIWSAFSTQLRYRVGFLIHVFLAITVYCISSVPGEAKSMFYSDDTLAYPGEVIEEPQA